MATTHNTADRLITFTPGTSQGDFRIGDWLLLGTVTLLFGSAFIWISLSLRSFNAPAVAFGRVVLGAGALALFPTARQRILRTDWARLVTVALMGMAGPALLFSLAEQRIDSSVAGMLVSSLPIATAMLGFVLTRRMPSMRRRIGLGIGSGGVLALVAPDVLESGANVIGVALGLLAIGCYAVSSHMYVRLQQTYGSVAVVMWSLVLASAMLAPIGIPGLIASEPQRPSIIALFILGILGTGVVRSLSVALFGRVGATRGSIVGYTIPVAALVLGVLVLGETVAPVQVAGVSVALLGGFLVSRHEGKETFS